MTDDFEQIVLRLVAEEVRFVVVGGMAAISHGSATVTQDLDICYERSKGNLERLSKVLIGLHATLRGAPKGLPFKPDAATLEAGLNFTFDTSAGAFDVLGEMAGLGGYPDIASRAVQGDLLGSRVLILDLDDLIRAKKVAGRPKDKLHLLELEDLRRLKRKRS